jgi:hypothetical protein
MMTAHEHNAILSICYKLCKFYRKSGQNNYKEIAKELLTLIDTGITDYSWKTINNNIQSALEKVRHD